MLSANTSYSPRHVTGTKPCLCRWLYRVYSHHHTRRDWLTDFTRLYWLAARQTHRGGKEASWNVRRWGQEVSTLHTVTASNPQYPPPPLPKVYKESKVGTRDSFSNPVLLTNNLCFCKRKSTLFVLSPRARIFKHGFSAIFLIPSRRRACRHLPCLPQVYLIIHDSNFHCVTFK